MDLLDIQCRPIRSSATSVILCHLPAHREESVKKRCQHTEMRSEDGLWRFGSVDGEELEAATHVNGIACSEKAASGATKLKIGSSPRRAARGVPTRICQLYHE